MSAAYPSRTGSARPGGEPDPFEDGWAEGATEERTEEVTAIRWVPSAAGFWEGFPFIAFGAVCLGIGDALRVASPATGAVVAPWAILMGLGGVALAGGLIDVGLTRMPLRLPPEVDPEAAEIPTEVEPPEAAPALVPRAGRLSDFPTAPSEMIDASTGYPDDRPGSLPAEDDPAGRGFPVAWTPRDPGEWRPGPDDVVKGLDEIASAVHRRGVATPGVRASPETPPAPQLLCGGCDRPIEWDSSGAVCRGCGSSLCPSCAETSRAAGSGGYCATCSVLEGISSAHTPPATGPHANND